MRSRRIGRERPFLKLEIMIMSGVLDGLRLTYSVENGDGDFDLEQDKWTLSIGRQNESDVYLRNDTFVSRLHAYIYWEKGRWWLRDEQSTNGTFVDNGEHDARVTTAIPISPGELFRIGHTWMRIEPQAGKINNE
jgi:pSer/pThr/pTyr-binding forkhead associated (FHA) protein